MMVWLRKWKGSNEACLIIRKNETPTWGKWLTISQWTFSDMLAFERPGTGPYGKRMSRSSVFLEVSDSVSDLSTIRPTSSHRGATASPHFLVPEQGYSHCHCQTSSSLIASNLRIFRATASHAQSLAQAIIPPLQSLCLRQVASLRRQKLDEGHRVQICFS